MICTIEGCIDKVYAKGWCHSHYNKQWRGKGLDLNHRWMTQEAKDYIVNALKAGMTSQAVADEMGYTKASVSKAFKREVGITITEWRKKRAAFEMDKIMRRYRSVVPNNEQEQG